MKFLKKYYKLIGTLITVVAFVFVIKKIVTMDVDWSMFASGKPLGIIAGCVLAFVLHELIVVLILGFSGVVLLLLIALPAQKKKNALICVLLALVCAAYIGLTLLFVDAVSNQPPTV